MNRFQIGDIWIGEDEPAFIIAEAGANHNGDLSIAKKLCDEALRIGCDCVKFQTFTAEEFCADPDQPFTYRSCGEEVTEPMIDLFKRLEFTPAEWEELMAYCEKIGILFLTTVQDPPNLELMLKLGLKGIKVGSDDFDYLINIKRYAHTGLPLIVSKGMASLGEVDQVLREVRAINDRLVVLHCVSLYPTEPEHLNIRQIPTLKALYPDVVWGFSDHSQGPLASTLAVALGAKVIEKHFTLDHDMPGPDHWFSMDVEEMAEMVRNIRFAEKAFGNGEVRPAAAEEDYKQVARRRMVAARNLRPGDLLDEDTVAFKRAGAGAFIDSWPLLQGRKLRRARTMNAGIGLEDVDFD